MSSDTMANVSYAVEGVALTIVAILGLIGNIALILIFWAQSNQKHVKALFISLAIFDLIFITCALLSFTTNEFFPDLYYSNVSLALPWLLPISQSALTGSVYFTIAISIERYLLVCKNRRSLERYHVAWIITPVILFSLAYNLPRFFELQVYQDEYSNSTHVIPTDMRMHHLYVHIYIVWINLFVMGIIPYALLITLNIWIFRKLWTIKHERRNGNEVRLSLFYAKLCFFVVAVFVLSHSIRWIPNICELYLTVTGKEINTNWPYTIQVFSHFSHLMLVFNSSINFYIYLVLQNCSKSGQRRGPIEENPEEMRTLATNYWNPEENENC